MGRVQERNLYDETIYTVVYRYRYGNKSSKKFSPFAWTVVRKKQEKKTKKKRYSIKKSFDSFAQAFVSRAASSALIWALEQTTYARL